jgi:indolepyruvate ferredoxin oxidoreductase beta subunit
LEHNILITSIGGQGGIALARVLAHAALDQGLNVRVGETLGMAQRGGSVQSHVRIGEDVHGSIIPRGRCDVLLSLEPSESLRAPEYLGPGTRAILSTTPVYPIPVLLKDAAYPGLPEVTSALERIGCRVYRIDARGLALIADAPASLNIVILGAYAALGEGMPSTESLRKAMGESLSKRFLDANNRAFEEGYEAMEKML